MRAGSFSPERLQATLAELCAGKVAGRTGEDEITLFKSVGTALEDLAAAELVYDATRASPSALRPTTAATCSTKDSP